ncbi:hypothetical protein OIU79_025900 [Salix purpurea]|uniref:Uncharacterized protein n=1 Tax=Salix purpurea TaxID=77065 RepID=A0A9Q1A7F5_SALPP|nr:hypothetical protein OIU79_025900 [Salix purpurea]
MLKNQAIESSIKNGAGCLSNSIAHFITLQGNQPIANKIQLLHDPSGDPRSCKGLLRRLYFQLQVSFRPPNSKPFPFLFSFFLQS